MIASYVYDAWGKVLSVNESTANSIGAKNAIRYRGYYYDTESNLYYLNARYYDPQVKRFINSDQIIVLDVEGQIISVNLYTYSINNPVNRIDSTGMFSWRSFWSGLKEVGTVVAQVATVTALVAVSVLGVVASVGGTICSYGAGAIAIPVAVAAAAECLATASIIAAGIGVVAAATGAAGEAITSNNSNRKVNVTKENSKIWKSFDNYKNGIKKSGKGSKLKYYTWDNLHNDIEVFNSKGIHLGSMDPTTGEMYKAAVPGRTLF